MNFRPVLCVAVTMITAIVLMCKLFVSQNARLVVLFVFGTLIIASVAALIIYKKTFFKFLLIITIAFMVPAISVYIRSDMINSNHDLNVENCVIFGKIYKINEKLDKNFVDVYLTDVELVNENNRNGLYGNYLLRVNSNNFDLSKINEGRYIKCKTKPSFYSLNSGKDRDISFIARDITGFSYVYSYNVFVTEENRPELRDNIKSRIYNYFEKTDLFFTGVGYAMMFGDSTMLDDSVYGVFESSGIIHLLAVSGFHVSVIVGFIMFVLKKLKFKNIANFFITAAIIFFYAYLCNFSVSVVRAGIMSLLSIYASMTNKECDRMSSMSTALIFILLINPLDLFNVSFVLSFVAVLSIILLLPVFERLFSKVFSEKLSGMLSLSISTSIGITAFQLYYFGQAPILSFLSNLITVPIVSVLFVFLLISILIGPLFGLVVPLINFFGIGIRFILQINNWIVGVGLFIFTNRVRDITLLLSVLLMYAVSDYLFIKRKNRIMLASLVGGLLLSLLVF